MMRARGFTLIEMMIAIFIALVIFTIGFATITATINARHEAEERIRSTENARMLFQMLEKDLGNAYPITPTSDITTIASSTSFTINIDNKPITNAPPGAPVALSIPNDHLEFFTRLDHRDLSSGGFVDTPDTYVFVRYFVNNLGHVCREIHTVDHPGDVSLFPFNAADDSHALFEFAYSMLVIPQPVERYNQEHDSGKSTPPCTTLTTHIQVKLFMLGSAGAATYGSHSGSMKIDSSPESKRVFMKTIAIPDVFRP